jgi:hypothetical protein
MIPITVCVVSNITNSLPTLGLNIVWAQTPPCNINYTDNFIEDLARYALEKTRTPVSRWKPALWFYSSRQSGTDDHDACAGWVPAAIITLAFLGLACFAVKLLNRKAAFTLNIQLGTP